MTTESPPISFPSGLCSVSQEVPRKHVRSNSGYWALLEKPRLHPDHVLNVRYILDVTEFFSLGISRTGAFLCHWTAALPVVWSPLQNWVRLNEDMGKERGPPGACLVADVDTRSWASVTTGVTSQTLASWLITATKPLGLMFFKCCRDPMIFHHAFTFWEDSDVIEREGC